MALFPGDSRYELLLTTSVSGTTITAAADVRKNAGGGFMTGDPQPHRIRISGVDSDGFWTYDFSGATPKTIRVASFARNVGYGTFLVEAWVTMDSGFGQAYESRWVTVTAPGSLPAAPTITGVSHRTPTSFRVNFSRGADGGSPIIDEQAQWATDAGFTVLHWTNAIGNGAYSDPSATAPLAPGVRYWVRVRSRNAVGWSAWSAAISDYPGGVIRRGRAGSFGAEAPRRGVDGAFRPAQVFVGRGGVFVPAE